MFIRAYWLLHENDKGYSPSRHYQYARHICLHQQLDDFLLDKNQVLTGNGPQSVSQFFAGLYNYLLQMPDEYQISPTNEQSSQKVQQDSCG